MDRNKVLAEIVRDLLNIADIDDEYLKSVHRFTTRLLDNLRNQKKEQGQTPGGSGEDKAPKNNKSLFSFWRGKNK